jgi:hypothetical protein
MRMALCRLPADGAIVVQMLDRSRVFRGGDRVDLEAIAAPAREDRAALTWGDVLGHHVDEHFEIDRPKGSRLKAAADGPVADASSVTHEE